jgi:nicotinamide-nucleotide amidase
MLRHKRIKCVGVSESELEQRLPDLIRRGRTPSVGITVSAATITLRITAAGATAEECDAVMQPTVATIRECLGTIIFGEEEDELEHAVVRLLRERGKTLATVEWGTGGLVGDRLHDVCGTHGQYLGGLVVPTPQALSRLLGVPADLIEQHTPVSGEVAAAMASGCRERLGADLALAVSEFPDIAARGTEPKRLFVALASDKGVTVRSAPHFGHPEILKARAAKQALNMVRLALLTEGGTP